MRRKSNIDWAGVDWSLSTKAIADMLGVKPCSVSYQRHKYAPKTVRARRSFSHDFWKNIDWSKSSIAIAEETGSHPGFVSQRRKQFAPQTVKKQVNLDLSNLDYTLSTTDLAWLYSLPMSVISRNRKRYAPETSGRTIPSVINKHSVKDNRRREKLSKKIRLKSVPSCWQLPAAAIPASHPDFNWQSIDWSLPDTQLAQRHEARLVDVRRARKKYSKVSLKKTYTITCPVCGGTVTLSAKDYNLRQLRTCGKEDCTAVLLARNAQVRLNTDRPPEWDEARLAAKLRSPRSGPYDTNVSAKEWRLLSPIGKSYQFRNLALWLRNHTHLFDDDALRANSKGLSRAFSGLSKLRPEAACGRKSWRGWTWDAS